MENENQTPNPMQTPMTTPSPKPNMPAKPMPASKPKSSAGLAVGLFIVSLVLILGTAGAGYFMFNSLDNSIGDVDAKVSMSGTDYSTLTQRISDVEMNIEEIPQAIEEELDGYITEEAWMEKMEYLKDVDTDKDGLSDYEEIFTYETNVANKDTDGDGNSDKQEVENGYNPNGEGMLEEIEEESEEVDEETEMNLQDYIDKLESEESFSDIPEGFEKVATIKGYPELCGESIDGPCYDELYILYKESNIVNEANNPEAFYLEQQSATNRIIYGPYKGDIDKLIDEAENYESVNQ